MNSPRGGNDLLYSQSLGKKETCPVCIGMIVMSYYPELCGGAERQCSRLTKELLRRGHNVKILTTRTSLKTPSRTLDGKLEIIRIPRMDVLLPYPTSIPEDFHSQDNLHKPVELRGHRFGVLSRLAALALRYFNTLSFMLGSLWHFWVLRNQVNVWHGHVAGLYAGWCGFWLNRLGKSFVCKGANLPVFSEEEAVPFRRLLAKWRRSLNFVALTQDMKQDLVANGVPASKIVIIPNGIDLPQHLSPRSASCQTGSVLYIANFTQPVANKAYDVLFAAWCNVSKARNWATLIVAGAGNTGEWKDLLWEHGVAQSVQFLGYVENIDSLYSVASMIVLPSRREGISNALLEAQAHGVPAVVSDIPGNCAVVIDGVTGLVVPVDDVNALTQAIIALLDDTERRMEMGRQAISRIESEFSIQIVVDRYLNLYKSLG